MSILAGCGVHRVAFGKELIEFQLRRSDRKTLAITVASDASVTVTAPRRAALNAVVAKVRRRAVWIRRQQGYFQKFLPILPPRRYVSGETHRFLGRQYRLKVVESSEEEVKLKGRFLHVETRRKRDTARVRALVEGWFIKRASVAFERSLSSCLKQFNGHVATAPRLRLRRMRKRWGSCTQDGVIYLNPELVKTAGTCIDYVVTHELCHLVYPHHGREFYQLLQRIMPDWERRKTRLESVAL
ncbi:MAG: M48 family peptidase [Proteobacteria bacterium]|nr:M48 family peptidase [Verrucomicrobiota bacterium]NBU10677.1 M48 family peptidase [Pseudomonadota bacterium]